MSNIITKTRLNYFASKLWENKIKPIKKQLDSHTHAEYFRCDIGGTVGGDTYFTKDIVVNGNSELRSTSFFGNIYMTASNIIVASETDSSVRYLQINRQCASNTTGYHSSAKLLVVDVEGGSVALELSENNKLKRGLHFNTGFLRPNATNAVELGTSAYRFKGAYLSSSPNVSSDRSVKEDISYIVSRKHMKTKNISEETRDDISIDDFYNFIRDDFKISSYRYKNEDENSEKNPMVLGFIAQDLTDTLVGDTFIQKPKTKTSVIEGKSVIEESKYSYDLASYVTVLAGALKHSINKIEELETIIKEKGLLGE